MKQLLRIIDGTQYHYYPISKKGDVTFSCCMMRLDDKIWINRGQYKSLRKENKIGILPRCRGRMKLIRRNFGGMELATLGNHDCDGVYPSMTKISRATGINISRDDAFSMTGGDNDDAPTTTPNDDATSKTVADGDDAFSTVTTNAADIITTPEEIKDIDEAPQTQTGSESHGEHSSNHQLGYDSSSSSADAVGGDGKLVIRYTRDRLLSLRGVATTNNSSPPDCLKMLVGDEEASVILSKMSQDPGETLFVLFQMVT